MTLPAPLADLSRHHQSSAFVTDFDGTLAPIVDEPADARALPAALDAMRRLVPRLALVGVVSGRPLAFLRDHVPIEGVALVGQYGLERLVGGTVVLDPRVEPYVDSVAAAATEAERRWPSLRIERKGSVAFTVHWRTAPRAAPGPRELVELADEHGLVVQPGRMACEVRTPVPVDKGTALIDMVRGCRVDDLAFAGDDHGDLAAFDAVPGDRDNPARLVRVAVRSPEAPPQLLERADIVVDGPAGLAELLSTLAEAVSPSPPP